MAVVSMKQLLEAGVHFIGVRELRKGVAGRAVGAEGLDGLGPSQQ